MIFKRERDKDVKEPRVMWGIFKNESGSTLMPYPVISGNVQLSLLALAALDLCRIW